MSKKKPAGAVRATASAELPADLKKVRDLARIANEYDLEEIELSPGGGIRVSRAPSATQPRWESGQNAFSPTPMSLVPPVPVAAASKAVADENSVLVSSPFVGTFYRAASPESAVFVEIGQMIRKGQVVCIVEAMKLMNEIEAEADGKLVEILVKNGQHVEYGQALFRLEKT